MLATEHFEEIGVWPIQLRIQDKMGHTLWTDNDDHDLSNRGRLLASYANNRPS